MAETPDSLTKAEFTKRGYRIVKVEKWGLHPHIHREDFLGIYDYMAFNDSDDFIFCIQTTTRAHLSDRRKKMLSHTSFDWWTKGRRRSLLHGWYKKNGRWALQEEELTMDDWREFQANKDKNVKYSKKDLELFKMLDEAMARSKEGQPEAAPVPA